jgi:hypothetical protein
MAPDLVGLLAGVARLSGDAAFVTAMVLARPDGELVGVELASWARGAGLQERPLRVEMADVPAVRRLVEHGAAALEHATYDEDGFTVLGRDGELALTAMRAPTGTVLAYLGWVDGTSGTYLPLDELDALATVLRSAESEIGNVGHMVEGSHAVN